MEQKQLPLPTETAETCRFTCHSQVYMVWCSSFRNEC